MIYIPDGIPHVQRSMVRDTNYLSSVNSFLGVWYESHRTFPTDENEFLEALKTGPAAWQYRIGRPPSVSDYAKGGKRLPYEIVVIQSASGPRLNNISEKPGVVYYCLAADHQRFWVTMSGLNKDVSQAASLKRVADLDYEKPWLVAGDGKDYPVAVF